MNGVLSCLVESMVVEELSMLAEEAKTASDLESEGLCLAVHNKRFTLYDPVVATNKLTNPAVGNIEIKFLAHCNNWKVEYSAARKGYGPVMYDIAMSHISPEFLRADTTHVSEDARKVWKYMFNHRGNEFLMEPIEDMAKEISKPFCGTAAKGSHKAFEYAYAIKNKLNIEPLVKNNNDYAEKQGTDLEIFNRDMQWFGGKLFNQLFKE